MTTPDDTLSVRVTNFELLRLLDGHELTLATLGGTPVKVRLYNTDELIAATDQAQSALPAEDRLPMTRQQAIGLCRPLSGKLR